MIELRNVVVAYESRVILDLSLIHILNWNMLSLVPLKRIHLTIVSLMNLL